MRWSHGAESYESHEITRADGPAIEAFARVIVASTRYEGLDRPDIQGGDASDIETTIGKHIENALETPEPYGRRYHLVYSGKNALAAVALGTLKQADHTTLLARRTRGLARRLPGTHDPVVRDKRREAIHTGFEFGVAPEVTSPAERLVLGAMAYQAALTRPLDRQTMQFTVHKNPRENTERRLVEAAFIPRVTVHGMHRGMQAHRAPVGNVRSVLHNYLSSQDVTVRA